jgi:hypothetical protein
MTGERRDSDRVFNVPDGFTVGLTPAELTFKQGVQPRFALQRALIGAATASGDRIASSVGVTKGQRHTHGENGGFFNLELHAYRLGRDGEPQGTPHIITLANQVSEEAVILLAGEYEKGRRSF